VAKSRKPGSARKPPEPLESHTEIDNWIKSVMPDLQPIVKALDKLVRDTVPGLHFALKWKKAYYGTPELGWIIEFVAYDVSVNLVFLGGAKFDDPPPLGSAGPTRYVKITTLEEAKDPEMAKWVEQAGGVAGWK
jgi:hypothetical protein